MTDFMTVNSDFGEMTLETTTNGVRLAVVKNGETIASSVLSAAETAQLLLLNNIHAATTTQSSITTLCDAQTTTETATAQITIAPTALQITATDTFSAALYVSLNATVFELIETFTANTLYILPYTLSSATWQIVITTNAGAITAVMS